MSLPFIFLFLSFFSSRVSLDVLHSASLLSFDVPREMLTLWSKRMTKRHWGKTSLMITCRVNDYNLRSNFVFILRINILAILLEWIFFFLFSFKLDRVVYFLLLESITRRRYKARRQKKKWTCAIKYYVPLIWQLSGDPIWMRSFGYAKLSVRNYAKSAATLRALDLEPNPRGASTPRVHATIFFRHESARKVDKTCSNLFEPVQSSRTDGQDEARRDKAGRSFAFKYNVERGLIDVIFNQPIRGKKLDSI